MPIVHQIATAAFATSTGNATANATSPALGLGVVCAWPVSGQYGPGSRVLYYVLVATCVFARKAEWLRDACLAAALLFPAVAALHGLVLAALHVNGAIDMDVYGAFQLCSIGILAAPMCVRLSKTYFRNPGKNTIFLWTGLILAGLLALTVEFYRATSIPCTHDDHGNPISANSNLFPYENAKCGIVCSVEDGPHSPMRGGSANNIYVIPAPHKLSFNTAMLLAAACCIPAILSMIFLWIKILDVNYKSQHGDGELDRPIEGTNGATMAKMRGVEGMVREVLGVIEVPLFSAAILAILAIGETNFFSGPLRYQTEPMASIGQWAPVAGTVLAALGSLYLLLTANPDEAVFEDFSANPSHQNGEPPMLERQPTPHPQVHPSVELFGSSMHSHSHSASSRSSRDLHHAPTVPYPAPPSPSLPPDAQSPPATIGAGRRRVAKFFTRTGNYLGTAAHNKFDVSDFKHGRAVGFPEIPGERNRNPDLPRIQREYSQRVSRDLETRLSRVGSAASSCMAIDSAERSTGDMTSPSPIGSPREISPGRRPRLRRDTLEVPPVDR